MKTEVDNLYLARNIASAIANISKSLHHEIGFVLDFFVNTKDNYIIFKKNYDDHFNIKVLKSDLETALQDRLFFTFSDDAGCSFLGHENLKNFNQCIKLAISLDHILLSIPDKKLSKSLVMESLVK